MMATRELPTCAGGNPPECCTPMDYDERARSRADALTALTPTRCPNCGSRAIAPLFWPDASLNVFDCCDCLAIFSGRGD